VHWCWLGEIRNDVSSFHPQYTVCDRDGKSTVIKLQFAERNSFNDMAFGSGNTVCILYAMKHDFMDGSQGILCEDASLIKGISGVVRD
jgi:hypothetical protein